MTIVSQGLRSPQIQTKEMLVKLVRNPRKPSPALIVAIAALCVALVGTAVAGPIAEISLNKQEKKQIRKMARNIATKIANRRITKRAPGLAVASAQNANVANVANTANGANTANSAKTAESAKTANGATNAENLQAPEAFHAVGVPGEPAFQSGFVNLVDAPSFDYETAGFYLDRQCVVHLKGVVVGNGGTVFTLPAGYRPAARTFSAIPATGEHGSLQVATDGKVIVGPETGSKNFGLSGETFRVAGC